MVGPPVFLGLVWIYVFILFWKILPWSRTQPINFLSFWMENNHVWPFQPGFWTGCFEKFRSLKPGLDAKFPEEYEIKKKMAKPLWASKTPANFLKNMQNSDQNDQILGHFWKFFFVSKLILGFQNMQIQNLWSKNWFRVPHFQVQSLDIRLNGIYLKVSFGNTVGTQISEPPN